MVIRIHVKKNKSSENTLFNKNVVKSNKIINSVRQYNNIIINNNKDKSKSDNKSNNHIDYEIVIAITISLAISNNNNNNNNNN